MSTEGQRPPQEIRTEIERTREEMGDTVAAVAAKTDLKAQARTKAEEAKGAARELRDEAIAATPDSPRQGFEMAKSFAKEKPLVVGGAALGLLVAWRLVRG